MKLDILAIAKTVALAVTIASSAWFASAQQTTQTDNTRINQRDRSDTEVTADQQKENPSDRNLTAMIRKSIISDKSMSTYARNIKVISQNGTVTLKGPVRTEVEKKAIEAKAAQVAGASKVKSEITIEPDQKSR